MSGGGRDARDAAAVTVLSGGGRDAGDAAAGVRDSCLLVAEFFLAVVLVWQGHRSWWPYDDISNVDLDGLRHCINHSFGHIIGVAEQLFGFLL